MPFNFWYHLKKIDWTCFEKGFMIQYSEQTFTHANMSGAEPSVAASLEGLCLPNSVPV